MPPLHHAQGSKCYIRSMSMKLFSYGLRDLLKKGVMFFKKYVVELSIKIVES